MHRNTYLLVSLLAVIAALIIGVNIGRQAKTPETIQPQLSPTPTIIAPLTVKPYSNAFCKVAFDYPANFTYLESASGSAAFTNPKGDDGILLTCQKDIPRPAITEKNIEDIQIGSVAAKLYNKQSLIFRHPTTHLDVFLAGTGEVFKKLLRTLTIL